MFGKASERTVSAMIKHGIVEESRKTVYIWGLSYLLDTVFNIALFTIAGIITGMLAETFMFTVAYIILRIYAGGYHADTPQRCCVLSLALLSGALVMITNAVKMGMILYVLTAAAVLIITFTAPVASENKPLSSDERNRYRITSKLILLAEELFAAAMLYLDMKRSFYVMTSVWTALSIMLVLGLIRKAVKRRQQRYYS